MTTAPTRRPAATRRVVSTAHGPLRHLLLCFPQEAALRRGYRAGYADLFATLPAATRLTVLVHPWAADVLGGLLAAAGRQETTTVVRTGEDLRFTVWAQDPCLVLAGDDAPTTLLTPLVFDREQDARTVELAAQATGAQTRASSLRFHGGYVLVGDDFVLVGGDCRDATLETLERDEGPTSADEHARTERAAARFREELGPDRRVLFVGTDQPLPEPRTRTVRVKGREVLEILPGGPDSPPPLGHLDMYLTLAGRGPSGRYRVLVGSPALADDILGRAPVEEVVSGHYDAVAAQLVGEGFEVIRNPLPLTRGDGRRRVDGQLRDVRLWYFATANNCLVQVDPVAGDHVWLPTYGHGAWRELAATDAANRRIWEELGFTVHELGSFHAFAQRHGALHCIAKELDRRPPA